MMDLKVPSEQDKRLLVKVLASAYKNHVLSNPLNKGKRKSLHAALDDSIRAYTKTDTDKRMFFALKRQVLALGDFRSYLNADDVKSVLGSILEAGLVDAVIHDHCERNWALYTMQP